MFGLFNTMSKEKRAVMQHEIELRKRLAKKIRLYESVPHEKENSSYSGSKIIINGHNVSSGNKLGDTQPNFELAEITKPENHTVFDHRCKLGVRARNKTINDVWGQGNPNESGKWLREISKK